MPPSEHPGLFGRLARVTELLPVLARRELRVRYRTSLLDFAWSVITPLALLAVYGLILTQSFDVVGVHVPYLSSAWTGMVLWTAFVVGVGGSVSSLVSSADLITKVYLPIEAVPLAVVVASMLELAVGLISVVMLAFVQGVKIGPTAVLAVVPIAVLLVWSAAISTWAAVLAVFVRDAVHGVHLVLRVGFFATPVMYDQSFLPHSLAWTVQVNPVAVAIVGVRDTVLRSVAPDWPVLAAQIAAGTLLLFSAVLYARAVESRAVDVV